MGSFNAMMDLPPTVLAPTAARHAVAELLRVWGVRHLVSDAELLVTELVTNAVEHVGGETSVQLELSLSDGRLRVSLADGSSVHPVMREMQGQEPRGRGMKLMTMVADRWGCEDHHGGKRVWFELGAPSTSGRSMTYPLSVTRDQPR